MSSVELRPCQSVHAYCVTLDRPLDPTGAIPGRISIHFEYYPHSMPGKTAGTLVATEGGPGFPETLSRDDYLALFKPLQRQRDVLLMENRGTGRSGAIDCHALRTAEKWTIALTAACGRSLGGRAAHLSPSTNTAAYPLTIVSSINASNGRLPRRVTRPRTWWRRTPDAPGRSESFRLTDINASI